MLPDRDARIAELVESTFGLSLRELRAFLDRECAEDGELRAEVERRIVERETMPSAHRAAATAAVSLATGDVVAGRYLITGLIGRGGMGEVYEAHDLIVKEQVALKTLRADLSENATLVKRFEDEIYLARKVTHPNVCRIYEVGVHPKVTPRPRADGYLPEIEHAPLLFFAMELLEGETLLARIARSPLTRAEAFQVAAQLAEGLHAAHRAGIVHADFKSANVILVPGADGVRAVITDFGVARVDPSRVRTDEGRTLSENVNLAGTLAYMSPEQLAGDAIGPASDLYSFGIVLFEMACGERPFDDRDVIRSAMLRASGEPAQIRSKVPNIDPRWEGAIRRCLQREPTRRFASAAELAAWFRGGMWRPLRYWTRQDWIRNTAAIAMLVLALAGGWTWWTRPYRPAPAALQAYETGLNAMYSMAYETARRALEQSVAADPGFALAHATLARAYDELDYTDRAKDSMLTAIAAAQESRLSQDDERRLRALQFMVSRDYGRAVPLVRQIEVDAGGAGRSAAALESGWLAQQMDDSGEAAAAFERALALDPSYAAAKLRLGFMYGRRAGQNDLSLALEAFDDAERLYRGADDDEGATQAQLERANLLVRRSRQKEALPILDEALAVARMVGNRYQEVRLLLLQGTALRDLDQTSGAVASVREAIDLASAQNMDNLATGGQIDLGNIHLRVGDFDAAEPIFQRALEMAERSKVRRIEARARMTLGSLYEQRQRPEQAAPLVQAGLAFYQQAGYQRESAQAAVLLGGLRQQLGENEESIRLLREALPSVVQLQDRRLESQLHGRMAEALRDRGHWPAALAAYQQAGAVNPSALQAALLRVTWAGVQWRLGQREEAVRSLEESARFGGNDADPRLSLSIRLERAEMAYADGRLNDALALARDSELEGTDEEALRRGALLQAWALVRHGRAQDGMRSAATVIAAYEAAKLPVPAAEARLALGEALLAAGDTRSALRIVEEALAYFESRQIWESVWRGHMIAAHAAQGEATGAHRAAADSALRELRGLWTTAVVDRYLARPDVATLVRRVR